MKATKKSQTTKERSGPVHTLPADLRLALNSHNGSMSAWKDITPLSQNEWICWITSAKKPETRAHRIKRTSVELTEGKRRPCCWAGCPHRSKIVS